MILMRESAVLGPGLAGPGVSPRQKARVTTPRGQQPWREANRFGMVYGSSVITPI
jgi:hypothetical protein